MSIQQVITTAVAPASAAIDTSYVPPNLNDIDEEDKNLSAFQLKERKERTVFVGNVPLETTRKYLEKLFGKHGEVEKVWFRSIALDHQSKIPHLAKIIKN